MAGSIGPVRGTPDVGAPAVRSTAEIIPTNREGSRHDPGIEVTLRWRVCALHCVHAGFKGNQKGEEWVVRHVVLEQSLASMGITMDRGSSCRCLQAT